MSEYKDTTIKELHKLVNDKRDALRAFRFGGAGSRSRNVREGRTLKREIAKLLTELRSRDLPAGKAGLARGGKSA